MGNGHRDVIVVGAGMAGLLTAFYLQEEGRNVLVLEADRIASGQTERTTAKITSQHGLKYSHLIENVGVKKARLYAMANEAAIREYERLIRENGIHCGFERVPSYLYTLQDAEKMEKEAQIAAFLGIDAVFTRETELPFQVEGAVCFRKQAQFDPPELIRWLASQLEIREHTKVTAVKGNRVYIKKIAMEGNGTNNEEAAEKGTEVCAEENVGKGNGTNNEEAAEKGIEVCTEEGELTADKIVIATHYPILNIPGFYFLRQHQERSYVLALSGCEPIHGMYYGADRGGFSFRQAGEYLLFGGSACRTGQNRDGMAYKRLKEAAEHFFPDAREEVRWAAQDCMPHDGIPFIGRYSMFTPNLYVATGFQKWGMTTSMVAAMLLRDEICGKENSYGEVFTPQRFHLKASAANLLDDVGMSVKGLGGGLFGRPRCSHLGCKLVWNPEERSWDCPCHGSRFTEDGKLLDNPSLKNLKNR